MLNSDLSAIASKNNILQELLAKPIINKIYKP